MNLKQKVNEINSLVQQGAIVAAVKDYFAEDATTSDFSGVKTNNKEQMVEKMEGFANAIAKVNGIEHVNSVVNETVSYSEFIFDFNMKDGSQIFWHEIIKRHWNADGKVVLEEYFKAN